MSNQINKLYKTVNNITHRCILLFLKALKEKLRKLLFLTTNFLKCSDCKHVIIKIMIIKNNLSALYSLQSAHLVVIDEFILEKFRHK